MHAGVYVGFLALEWGMIVGYGYALLYSTVSD